MRCCRIRASWGGRPISDSGQARHAQGRISESVSGCRVPNISNVFGDRNSVHPRSSNRSTTTQKMRKTCRTALALTGSAKPAPLITDKPKRKRTACNLQTAPLYAMTLHAAGRTIWTINLTLLRPHTRYGAHCNPMIEERVARAMLGQKGAKTRDSCDAGCCRAVRIPRRRRHDLYLASPCYLVSMLSSELP